MLGFIKKNLRSASLLLCGMFVFMCVSMPAQAGVGTNWYFEDFSGAIGSVSSYALNTWFRQSTGGISNVNSDKKFELARTSDTDNASATYTLPSVISSGKMAVEFVFYMNGTLDKTVQFNLKNSAGADLAIYQLRQNDGIYMRRKDSTTYDKINSSTALAKGEELHFKCVIDFEADIDTKIQTYVNSELSVVTRGFMPATVNVGRIVYTIVGVHNGAGIIFDDLKIYTIPSEAATVVESLDGLGSTITNDLKNVTSNMNLITADAVNGTTISWSSDNTEVISNEGVVNRPTDESVSVKLTATATKEDISTSKTFTAIVAANQGSVVGEDWYFEGFSQAISSTNSYDANTWYLQAGSVGSVGITPDQQLELNRTGTGGGVNANYTLPSIVSSGSTTAIEFKFYMDSMEDKTAQFHLKNSDGADIAIYQFRQNSGIYIRRKAEAFYDMVDDSIKLVKGQEVHFKAVINVGTDDDTNIQTYINGVLSEVTRGFMPATVNLGRIFYTIASAQQGGIIVIDDFKVYRTSSDAEDVVKSARLTEDLNNITSDLNLITNDMQNGTTIKWSSNNTEILTNDGVVNRPVDEDANVTLVATIQKGDVRDEKVYTLTVPANRGTVQYINSGFRNDNNVLMSYLVDEKNITGVVKLNNDTNADEDTVIVLALYDGDTKQLIQMDVQNYTIPANTANQTITASFILPEGSSNYILKRFVFDSMNSIKPMMIADIIS